MKTKFIEFLKEFKIGALIGAGISIASLLIFFWSLGYGASCPEAGDETCFVDIRPLLPFLALNMVPMSVWMIIFFAGQQIMLFFGIVTSDGYSSSFFATSVMPVVSFVLTIFVWAIIGGLVHLLYRKIRK